MKSRRLLKGARDAQILLHQPQCEPAGEGLGDHELLELGLAGDVAAARSVEHIGEDLDVEIERASHRQCLGYGEQAGGIDVVVQRLHRMRGTHPSRTDDGGPHRLENRAGALEFSVVSADEDGQRAGSRLDDRAGDRRVDQCDAFCRRRLRQLAGFHRVGRAHVDDHCAGLQAVEQTGFSVASENDGVGDRTVGQYGDDDLAIGELSGRRGDAQRSAERRMPFELLQGLGGAVKGDQVEIRPSGKILQHGQSHDAQPDETDAHGVFPILHSPTNLGVRFSSIAATASR